MLAKNVYLGAPLKEILAQELTSFSNQTTVTACDITVNTRTAENFSLIVHELVTNAVKYGALSTRQGRVDIQCRIENADGKRQLLFGWRESGGPLVSQPTRKGFGSAVLLQAAKQFSQDVQAKYAPEGLTYQLRLSLSEIEAPQIEVTPLGRSSQTEGVVR
jgi:two-component sensor histidine kinase